MIRSPTCVSNPCDMEIETIWQKKDEEKGLFIRVSRSFEEMAFLN